MSLMRVSVLPVPLCMIRPAKDRRNEDDQKDLGPLSQVFISAKNKAKGEPFAHCFTVNLHQIRERAEVRSRMSIYPL